MICTYCSLPNYESNGHVRHADCILIFEVEERLQFPWTRAMYKTIGELIANDISTKLRSLSLTRRILPTVKVSP